jgi:hypothetical protein
MKRSILILTMLLAVTVFSIAPVMAPCLPAVEICKTPFCLTYPGPGPGEPGDRYSSNPIAMDNGIPVYPTGMKLFWWIEINVTALDDLTDVVVYDRLGAEFMVEGIYTDSVLPHPGPTPEPALTWEFDYDGKNTTLYPITYGQAVSANGASGTVDKGDMFKGTDGGINFGEFRIFWTGNSCKVHFTWTIGGMTAGETATIYLVISTDLNPAGHQEFTSPGTAFLNSGATVKGFVEKAKCGWRQVSAEADPIEIKVVWD